MCSEKYEVLRVNMHACKTREGSVLSAGTVYLYREHENVKLTEKQERKDILKILFQYLRRTAKA